MPIRFQADADLNQIIVSAVVRRSPEIDFRTATAAGLAGLKDADVLTLAANDGRILVTHDQATMPKHLRDSHLGGHATRRMDESRRLLAYLTAGQRLEPFANVGGQVQIAVFRGWG